MTSGGEDTTTGAAAESGSLDDTGQLPSGTESDDGPPATDPWAACHRLTFNAPPAAPGLPEVPVLVLLFHAVQNWEEGFEVIFPALAGTGWELPSTLALLLVGLVAGVLVWRSRRAPDRK
jgi:hypothetical protein